MTLRGTYKGDRVIILDQDDGLRFGQAVDVQPASRSPRAAPKKKKSPAKASSSAKRKIWGAGMWADRTDFEGMTTEEIGRELRRRAMGGRYGA